MRHYLLTILKAACVILIACPVFGAEAPAEPNRLNNISLKKGVGLGGFPDWIGDNELTQLKVRWYYNWRSKSSSDSTEVEFVPMLRARFKGEGLEKLDFLLGFNEPDHPKQDNMSVKDALDLWPNLVAKTKFIVAPAMAGSPVKEDSWLREFMKAKPKVDAIAVHWYRGADPKRFIDDMSAIYDQFKLPIWVTEYACQTNVSSVADPKKFSQSEVNKFIEETTEWMDKTPWMQRYAWHSPTIGTSCLYNDEGRTLSATGRAYAKAGIKPADKK